MEIDYNLLFEISDSTGDALQVSEESGQLIFLNKEASLRLGIPQDKIREYYVPDFEKIFGDRNSIKWQAHVQELKEKKQATIEGLNINQQTGKKIPVEVFVRYKVIDGKGYIIATSRDISDRVELYSEITNQHNTISTLYNTFQRFLTSPNYRTETDLGLDRVVDFLNFDAVTLYFFNKKRNAFVKDYEYTRYEQHFKDLIIPEEVSFDEFFGIYSRIKDGEPLLLESDDSIFEHVQFEIHSNRICYFIPLIDNLNFIGFYRIDETKNEDNTYINRLEKYKNYSRIVNSSMSLQRRNLDLMNSNKLFKNLYQSINDVFFIYDVFKKQYEFISPSCEKVFGMKQELFYEKEIHNNQYIVEKDRILFENGITILKSNDFTSFEYKINHPSVEVKNIFIKMYPIRDNKGTLIKITGLCMDITEKKQIEEKLKVSSQIIQTKNKELENKNLKIEELLKQQETDLYLKTIKLSNINSMLKKTNNELDSLLLEYDNRGKQSVKKIKKYIDDILNNGNNNWQEIQIEFEKIRPHFFKSLIASFPSLTPNDLKHCYYIVSGLSSGEVSELINLTIRSVETSRYRIKRKLNLTKETSLFDFLNRY
jgi:PAS domain S-box-containing protein